MAAMHARFCSACGGPLAAGVPVCPECRVSVAPRATSTVSGILVRTGGSGPEALLVRRLPTASHGAGLWRLPGKVVDRGEDARDAVVRAFAEQAGLGVEIVTAWEVHSNLHDPDDPTVGAWFKVRSPDPHATPRAGGAADRAEWFPLATLPTLAFPTDQLVLERLAHESVTAGAEADRQGEAQRSDLAARLARRRQKYQELLEAYTNELMRGAWINELQLRLSAEASAGAIASMAAEHLAGRREVDHVQVWVLGPPDRCDRCPWHDRCPRDRCLHLVASARAAPLEEGAHHPLSSAREERIPLLRGVAAADVALTRSVHQAELPGAGALPVRFEGFPLDVGDELPGVLGLSSRTPIDANARRLFEVVTRHVAALVRNARLFEDLRAANNVKRSFITRLSHELKTPLTAILGYAELLREELVAAGQALGADGAATIEASGRKLLDMVESILEIAKLESNTAVLNPGRTNLADVAGERVTLFLPRASEKGLTLTLVADPARGTVWADPKRVRQVIDQLLSNAIKFTSAGGITVTIVPGDDDVACEVRDTGIGIAPEHLKSVFDAFHQLTEQIHLEYGGLGIGLALAKTLVERQGGTISVESQPGHGSTFSFTLPRSATQPNRPDTQGIARPAATPAGS